MENAFTIPSIYFKTFTDIVFLSLIRFLFSWLESVWAILLYCIILYSGAPFEKQTLPDGSSLSWFLLLILDGERLLFILMRSICYVFLMGSILLFILKKLWGAFCSLFWWRVFLPFEFWFTLEQVGGHNEWFSVPWPPKMKSLLLVYTEISE